MSDRFGPQQERLRPHPAAFGAAAVMMVAVSAGAGAFLLGDSGVVARSSLGETLKIELVAPIEPALEAGDVMDVGEVTDGFVYVRTQMEPERFEPVTDYWADEPVYVNDYQPPTRPTQMSKDAVVYRMVTTPGPVIEHDDRAFGFDAPRRDYRAEREARRARIEALAEQSSERSLGWEPEDAPPPEAVRQSDSTFY